MKEGWEYKEFEDCLVKAAKAKQVKTSDYNAGSKYPIISQEDKMISGYCDDSSLLYHIDCPVVIFGDHTRVLKYVDFDFVVGADGVKILVPKDFLNARFLLYYLQWYKVPSLGYSRHYKLLKEINLPIPPLAEQERIVAELDLLSSIIEKKKAQLKELDQLAQSIFYDMFGTTIEEKGWEVKKMGEIGTFQRGGGFLKSDFVENGVPCIHYGQIHMKFGPFLYQHLTEIPKEVAAKSKIASKGDVIIAITSEDVEGSCKCTAWLGDYDVYVGAHAAIFKHSLNPIYVSYYIGASEFQREKQKYVHGIKVMEIKPSDIEKINILLPPLPLQQEFADKVEAIERQKTLIQQSIVEVQTLFDSRMDYWFG